MRHEAKPHSPDWDHNQLEVILAPQDAWQLVVAGPGAGKTAVACKRVAHLVDGGASPSRILIVSFTRTAVAELRDRIVAYADLGERARSVRISTLDSHAWSLRHGFDEGSDAFSFTPDSYEINIRQACELFRAKHPDLLEFMGRLEHLIVDEAQDILDERAELIEAMLLALDARCGVTILADPAQAIYGFTSDSADDGSRAISLLEMLREMDRPILHRTLERNHRLKNPQLAQVFASAREVLDGDRCPTTYVEKVQDAIAEACGVELEAARHEALAEHLVASNQGSTMVLFRYRAEVVVASSYCSSLGVEHRLRMSGTQAVMQPWIGWLFAEVTENLLSRNSFSSLWASRAELQSKPFHGWERDNAWVLLHRLAAGKRPDTIDLMALRTILSRAHPPAEICYPDLGTSGPILGTIHAAKGREADSVVLFMPRLREEATGHNEPDAVFEEGRVFYVAATRARQSLATVRRSVTRVGYLDSGRVYRMNGRSKAQLEIGREGDVDRVAHLSWSSAPDVQRTLAACVGSTMRAVVTCEEANDYTPHISIETQGPDGVTQISEVGAMGKAFRDDLKKLWGRVDKQGKLRPANKISHLYMVAVGSVVLSESDRNAAKWPFSQSRMALMPVIKGFPQISFPLRRGAKR